MKNRSNTSAVSAEVDNSSFISVPVVRRTVRAKKNCKLCHGKGSLRAILPADIGSDKFSLVPCECLIKIARTVKENLAHDEMIDFDSDKNENVSVVVQLKSNIV